MKCNEFLTLIDSYFKGSLPEEKQEEFEAHYFECSGCYTDLKIREQLYSKDVRITLEQEKIIPIWKYWKPVLAIAASIVIAVIAFLIIDHSNTIKKMYRISQFNPPVYISTETRNPVSTSSSSPFSEAMKSYNNKEYHKALTHLDKIPETQTNPQVTFFKGICYLLLDRKESAITEFDHILNLMNASYYDEALYFKAIALLRMNKKAEAIELLKNLSQMFSPYSSQAKKLISDASPL